MKIAAIDNLDPWSFLADYVPAHETSPYSSNFEFFSIGDKNFLFNSGSFFTVLVLIAFTHITGIVLYSIAGLFPSIHLCRKVGMSTFNKERGKQIKYSLQKTFLEMYFDLFICLVLHVLGWVIEEGGFTAFVQTKTDIAITVLVIVMAILGLVFPAWCYFKVLNNFARLSDPKTREELSVILESSRTKNLQQVLYTFYFVIRRFLCALILVLLIHYPYLQCIIMLVLSLLNLTYVSSC